MKDTIYRQDAIEALDKEYRCTDRSDDWEGLKTAMLIIENLSSAQPTIEKRKTGKWIDNETSYADGVRQTCTCSICGQRSVRPLGRFYRWCGADMRGERDE